jgi:hypothetical protein
MMTATVLLDATYVTEQCLIEHRTLAHVKAALRLALEWQVGPPGLPRKAATVRFMAQSFRRHIERLMQLEEKDGYMEVVGQLKPNLVDQARRLRDEHDVFRVTLARLLPRLESVADTNGTEIAAICDELDSLLHAVDIHDARETALIQDVVTQDEGGEGG